MPEPFAILKRKESDMRYAQLDADVQENLRSKAVTTWFESAETRPGNNAKADTAAREMLVCCPPEPCHFIIVAASLQSLIAVQCPGGDSLRGQALLTFFSKPPHQPLNAFSLLFCATFLPPAWRRT